MKLTLNINEVEQAIAQYIIDTGFPVDMSNAVYDLTSEGCDIIFQPVLEVKEDKPKVKRTRKTKASEIEKSHVTEVDEDGDLVLAELDTEVEAEEEIKPVKPVANKSIIEEEDEIVEEDEGAGNDFSLFS